MPAATESAAAEQSWLESQRADQSIVLRIGNLEVSRYVLDKNLARFRSQVRESGRTQPTTAETQAWFESFVAKHVIMAEAMALGYGERREVATVVDRMEKYMLSQPEGPYYERLYARSEAGADAGVERVARMAGKQFEIVGVRVPSEALIEDDTAMVESDGDDELRKWILKAGERLGAVYHEGSIPWFGGPFPEIAAKLDGAVAGSWLRLWNYDGVTAVRINRVLEHRIPAANRAEMFEHDARRFRRQEIQRAHRLAVLEATGFTFNIHCGRDVCSRIAGVRIDENSIPAAVVAPLSDRTLAQQILDGRERRISVEEWRGYYEAQPIRRAPTNVADLRAMVQDMVVAEQDCSDARRTAVDQTPKFIEDRLNFQRYQALDLFEREVLASRISADENELRQFLRRYPEKFSRPERAIGTVFAFSSEEQAELWLLRERGDVSPASEGEGESPNPVEILQAEATLDRPASGLEPFTFQLLQMPSGEYFGPVFSAGRALIFRKDSTVTGTPPFEQVRAYVLSLWMRERLDALEVDRARGLVEGMKIDDRIPYADYGVVPVFTRERAVEHPQP